MEQYIPKSALVAEIDRRIATYKNVSGADRRTDALISFKNFLNIFEVVKEVDLEKAIDDYIYTNNGRKRMALELDWKQYDITFKAGKLINFAKHIFELGFNASNPITKVNLESLVREVIDLYLEAGKHYDSVIKEERKKYGSSDLAIKLLDGSIDAEELGIQYILDKLKTHE